VIGVGGGGSNAVARMVEEGMDGIEFYAMNTDAQALAACSVPHKLQLGGRITNGLGAGSNPEKGREAALENTDAIVEMLQGADMVFVTATMGGGTGTGAAPVVASLARELDALTIAVVTKPFAFEGPQRMRAAEEGIAKLAASVDAVISMPNDRLLQLVPRGTSFFDAFKTADDLLRQVVQSISDIIVTPGLINRDFSDIKATMSGMGYAVMGTGTASGANAAVEAARLAINSPLLENASIAGSRGILMNIAGSSASLGLHEVYEACSIVREAAQCTDVQLSFGVIQNEAMKDSVKITVIATGFHPEPPRMDWRSSAATPVVRVPPPADSYRLPEPEPIPAPVFIPEPEPEPEGEAEPAFIAEAEPMLDLDDLDTPAYLRQGRLLN
jgi:cell division protein FtsZ